jgi:hypothetical protein
MKTLLAIALSVGLPFAGFCGTTNETNNAAQTQPEQLLTRTYVFAHSYKIDKETFVKNLTHLAGFKDGESEYYMLLRFFRQNGVAMEEPTRCSWSQNYGLYFQATQTDLNKIEKLMLAIQNNAQPSEVH